MTCAASTAKALGAMRKSPHKVDPLRAPARRRAAGSKVDQRSFLAQWDDEEDCLEGDCPIECHGNVGIDGEGSLSWADLAPEHLNKVAAFAERADEICRAEVVCRTWFDSLHDTPEAFNSPWRQLCLFCYPTLAARVIADEEELDPSGKPERPTPNSTPSTAASSTPAGTPGLEPLPPPIMDCPKAGLPAASSGSSASSWRELFRRRFLRQQEWDAKKAKQCRRRDSAGAGRTRACRRCGTFFDPRGEDICRHHPGTFALADAKGSIIEDGSAASRHIQERAQSILKAQNRKKASRKAKVIVFGAACESGVAREDGISWRWSCCGEESVVADGCSSGRHL
mmetsp:Transcript_35957/g.84226  ORF Transcript_35957/g.84226 Transcript_35957/m.84226 type:complete len:340 (+) Transcript_35957:83-1102(+)